jgi:hypothetical protein
MQHRDDSEAMNATLPADFHDDMLSGRSDHSPLLGDKAAHALVGNSINIGYAWVRWALAGHGGAQLQGAVQRGKEWVSRNDRVRTVLAAPRTKQLLVLGDRALTFADRKIDDLQRTKIGRPVCMLIGAAAKRAVPLVQPRSFGRVSERPSEFEAVMTPTQYGAAAAHLPSTPRVPPACTPPRVRAAITQRSAISRSASAVASPVDEGSEDGEAEKVARTGGQELGSKSEDLLKALSAPFLSALGTLSELAAQDESKRLLPRAPLVDSDGIANGESEDVELLLAAGLPTGRSMPRTIAGSRLAQPSGRGMNHADSWGSLSRVISARSLAASSASRASSGRESNYDSDGWHCTASAGSLACSGANTLGRSEASVCVGSASYAGPHADTGARARRISIDEAVLVLKEHARVRQMHTMAAMLDAFVSTDDDDDGSASTCAHAHGDCGAGSRGEGRSADMEAKKRNEVGDSKSSMAADGEGEDEGGAGLLTWVHRMGGIKVASSPPKRVAVPPATPCTPPQHPLHPLHASSCVSVAGTQTSPPPGVPRSKP